MKLLNKNNLAVSFAAATEESRYTCNAVLVTDKETVATDGHILARVSLPQGVEDSAFPTIEGFKPNGFSRALIPLAIAKEIEKAIPKKTTIPILGHAAISSETTDDGQKVTVCVTDLDNTRIMPIREVTGQFPNWQAVFPKKDPVLDISFDAELLKRIATAASKFSDKTRGPAPIRLRFYGPNEAMRFDCTNDGQEMNGLAMPLRADVKPKYGEPEPKAEEHPLPDDAILGLPEKKPSESVTEEPSTETA